MSREELEGALGEVVALDEESAEADCIFATLPGYRWGISWMLIGGRVVRTDVTERAFATVSGVRVGDRERLVLDVYRGRVRVTEHAYLDQGHYLTVESPDHQWAAVFETDGSRVTGYRIGHVPEAFYIEGCR